MSAFAGSLGAGGVAVMATQSRHLRALMDRIALMISGILLPVAAILIYLAMCLTVIHIHTTRLQVPPEVMTIEQAKAALREAGEERADELRYERVMPCVGQHWLLTMRPRLSRPCWHAYGPEGSSWTVYTEAHDRVAVVGDGGFESWNELGWLALAALLLLFNRALIDINHTAIHGFYRDRLSRAFLLRPGTSHTVEHADGQHLHEMNPSGVAPYHLYNVAINLSGSTSAQARDRGADFFILSKRYCGGPSTGWVETDRLEDLHPHLDVGTAMAISGAAAAPNMGGYTRSQLSPLMALLNFRLGYWLPNPVYARSDDWRKRWRLRMGVPPSYLLHEALSRTDAEHPFVNLSDGGHIENMGVYELLRRRCAVIVMIDGEADAASNFPGLTALERLARIDLGVELQFDPATLAAGPDGLAQTHVQTGSYRYANGETGLLIYLRANLTGDEAHSVLSYRRRSPSFPHESTADQFFTEEQFEAYRALGEHAAVDVADRFAPARQVAPRSGTPLRLAGPGPDRLERAGTKAEEAFVLPRRREGPALGRSQARRRRERGAAQHPRAGRSPARGSKSPPSLHGSAAKPGQGLQRAGRPFLHLAPAEAPARGGVRPRSPIRLRWQAPAGPACPGIGFPPAEVHGAWLRRACMRVPKRAAARRRPAPRARGADLFDMARRAAAIGLARSSHAQPSGMPELRRS